VQVPRLLHSSCIYAVISPLNLRDVNPLSPGGDYSPFRTKSRSLHVSIGFGAALSAKPLLPRACCGCESGSCCVSAE